MLTITIPETVTLPTGPFVLIVVCLLWWVIFSRIWDRLWNIYRVQPEGFIYLMQRTDGLYKIGYTNDLKARGEALSKHYRQPVRLITNWAVPNVQSYEDKALAITRQFAIDDTELRNMSLRQVLAFIFVFSVICEKMASPKGLMTIWRG